MHTEVLAKDGAVSTNRKADLTSCDLNLVPRKPGSLPGRITLLARALLS
jgi:hypothetical protein